MTEKISADKPVIEAFIEIPKYSRNKYEFDHEAHVFRLDRTLYSAVHYPTDYGFVEHTLAEDTDPLDVMVLLSQPTFPGCIVDCRIIGALEMSDEAGPDTKMLGVAVNDPRYQHMYALDDVPTHTLREIEYFFTTYKDLEGEKEVHMDGWKDVDFAVKIYNEAVERYQG